MIRAWFLKMTFLLAVGVSAASARSQSFDFLEDADSDRSGLVSLCSTDGNTSCGGNFKCSSGLLSSCFKRRVADPGVLFDWRCQSSDAGIEGLDSGLISDRPDFTEASSVVGLGVLQIEAGYTYTFDDDGADRTSNHSYPETLFRYGIFRDWLELRVASNFATEETASLRSRGAEDLYLGFKIGLTAQDGMRPEMALMPQMTVPTGGSAFTSNEVLPGLNYLYGWGINDFLSTAGSTQFNRALDETTGESYTQWAQSWTIGYELSERLGGYTECFGIGPSGADTEKPQYYFDGGLTYSVSNDIQLDIRAGKGLNNAADDYFVGSGLVVRFQ
jgi:Putative MetA-pathway of phenol degradation